jgi:hypothetical protein
MYDEGAYVVKTWIARATFVGFPLAIVCA